MRHKAPPWNIPCYAQLLMYDGIYIGLWAHSQCVDLRLYMRVQSDTRLKYHPLLTVQYSPTELITTEHPMTFAVVYLTIVFAQYIQRRLDHGHVTDVKRHIYTRGFCSEKCSEFPW